MKKQISLCVVALILATFFIGQTAAAMEKPLLASLESKFGPVMSRDLDGVFEFTLSSPMTDVEMLLQMIEKEGWYVVTMAATIRDDGKLAIVLKGTQQRNAFSKKFAALQWLLKPGMLPWKDGELTDKMPVVTSVETDFSDKISILGQTRRSGLIFTHLFPMIERIEGLSNPFFARGTYSDSSDGRIMNYTVNCTW